MLANRPWRRDLAAAILLLAGVLLTVAVVSHDTADLPDTVFPPNPTPKNFLGHPGALFAGNLLQSFGTGTYALLAGWFVLALLLFLWRDWFVWSRRIVGCLVLMP